MLSALEITSLGRERKCTFLLQVRSAPLQNHFGATLAPSLGNLLLFLASHLGVCFSWHLLFAQRMVYPHRSWDAGPRLLAAQMLALNKDHLISFQTGNCVVQRYRSLLRLDNCWAFHDGSNWPQDTSLKNTSAMWRHHTYMQAR